MSGAGLQVLAVDDERPALDDLVRLLAGADGVGRVEAAGGAADALVALGRERFDAVFLDVRMPGLDGVELARLLRRFAAPPAVVFVSAYETAAVDAFEVRAVDYLVKPVSRRRLAEAVRRVGGAPAAAPAAGGERDVVAVETARGATRLIPRAAVLGLQAHGEYVRVRSDEGRFLLRATLTDVEQRWEHAGFVRVHRAHVVNLRRAVEVRPHPNGTAVVVLDEGSQVPIARRQVGELRRRLSA